MRFVLFCHSVASCWNNGNAHFLRGIVRELKSLGHEVEVYEPADGWSRTHLTADFTSVALEGFRTAFPFIRPRLYDPATLDLEQALDSADVVIVHAWNPPELVARIGRMRLRQGRFLLLFHDTHHRALTAPDDMAAYNLEGFDGVLACGEVIRDLYLRRGWSRRAWTWHEAADTAHFSPIPSERCGDLVWIGNWDDERAAGLREFLLEPAQRLGLRSAAHGVRYPQPAQEALSRHGVDYRGWLANHRVPAVVGRYGVTVHIPRRPYAEALPGIPGIRVFEALACGIPLICAPWHDTEGLFRPGTDFLMARSGEEMERRLRDVLSDRALARNLAARGRKTILSRHTCRHRVFELLEICRELGREEEHRGTEVRKVAEWGAWSLPAGTARPPAAGESSARF